MIRLLSCLAAVAASMPVLPLAAQAPAAPSATAEKKCEVSEKRKRGSAMFGQMLGGLARRAVGSNPVGNFITSNTFVTFLTDAIACKLDKSEQKQAATATNDALRGGVGSSSSWTSGTRAGVSGTSTVTAQTASADGGSCMNVNDVVIVNGEETTVSKRMCRSPGASGYVLSA